MPRRPAKIVEFRAKIRKVVDIVGNVFFFPRSFSEPELPVISNFRLRCFDLEASVPGAAIFGTKPRSARRRMTKSSVDDSIRRNSEDQLARVDPRRQPRFREETVVGCVIQFKDAVQGRLIIGKPSKHRRAAIREFRRDQAMRISLVDLRNLDQLVSSSVDFDV